MCRNRYGLICIPVHADIQQDQDHLLKILSFSIVSSWLFFLGGGCCLFVLRQSFSVALEPVLELALVDQAGLDLTEIRLPLPPKYWD